MEPKKYKLSVNPNFTDKTPDRTNYFREGFHSCEMTLDDIAEAINEGYTISYQFRDGIRRAANFIGTDILAVDIDDGLTITSVEEHPVFQQYCSMRYVTPSHTPDHHRFRLIFTLPRTLTKSSELRAAAQALTKRFDGDLKATDPARIFHGHRNSFPTVYDRSITTEFLDELLEDGRTIVASESVDFAGSTSTRSEHQLAPAFVVTAADGNMLTVGDIQKTTPIYCPFHNDRKPSAFVARSSSGGVYLHCVSCQKTWHVKGSSLYDLSFNDFDLTVRRIKEEIKVDDQTKSILWEFLEAEGVGPKNITITQDEHLSIRGLSEGITLIKSPKGTGKTTYLAGTLAKILIRYATLEEYEEDTDFETEKPFLSSERVLLVGHRRALIGDLCKRLSLNNYQDDEKADESSNRQRRKRYGVCLDSLYKVRNETYDIVVIDEVEQVLSHFLSETIGEKRQGLFEIFSDLLSSAKKIVALDADLGWVSYITLTEFIRQPCSIDKPVQIFINNWQPKNRELLVYNTSAQLIQQIKKSVMDGKRVFITSNSKAKIKALTEAVKSLANDTGAVIPLISITSENSESQAVQTFIRNIKTEILNYRVVLSSPSLGTGVDISFENGNREVDAVFGLFENQINTHFEIDQQLARVRNPGSVHVWVSPSTYSFETEFRVAAKDFLHRHLLDTVRAQAFAGDWDILSREIDPFLRMAGLIVSQQRASKNRLKANLLRYRREQGWSIQFVDDDPALKAEGKALFKHGKDIADHEWREAIINAEVLNRVAFERLQENIESEDSSYSAEEWYSYYRTQLELFYGRVIDHDLLEEDRKYAWRREITLYIALTELDDNEFKRWYLRSQNRVERRSLALRMKIFRDKHKAVGLLYELLSTTPIFKDGKFDPHKVFGNEDLGKFAKAAETVKDFVLAQLEVNTQKDLDQKPVQHLGKIVRTIGLDLKKVTQSTKGGKKTYFYSLDSNAMAKMSDVVARRSDPTQHGWQFVDRQYRFQYSAVELDWLQSIEDWSVTQPRNRRKARLPTLSAGKAGGG
jgi:hypothetical protein